MPESPSIFSRRTSVVFEFIFFTKNCREIYQDFICSASQLWGRGQAGEIYLFFY